LPCNGRPARCRGPRARTGAAARVGMTIFCCVSARRCRASQRAMRRIRHCIARQLFVRRAISHPCPAQAREVLLPGARRAVLTPSRTPAVRAIPICRHVNSTETTADAGRRTG
jgi:hypothetical protein